MDYEVHGITISQPSIGDILEIGEDKFYASISPLLIIQLLFDSCYGT